METCDSVLNRISLRSLLDIAIILELPIMSIDFLLAFTQAGLDMDVFMELPLGMGFYVNRVEWGIKLNKSLYGINKASGNWFNPLKNGLERSFYHRSQVESCVFYKKELVV